jgi:hypothetical protein
MTVRTPLTSIKETLNAVITKLNEVEMIQKEEKRRLLTRIQKIANTATENERKIWLRTKIGTPMVQRFQDATDKLLSVFDVETPKLDDITAAMNDVEVNANRIGEESRRRNMVVT